MVEMFRNKIGGLLFVLFVFWLTSFLGAVFIMGPFQPLLFIYTPLYRRIMDHLLAKWVTFPVALLEMLFGIKIVVSGDSFRPNEKSIIIMNHRTRLDWMFLWSCLIRRSALHHEKIMLKIGLKNIPGGGWAMQAGHFIFIHRNWELDKQILTDVLDYFSAIRHPTQILIFPEGTDLSDNNKMKSADFAKKNGLQVYEYVLHPRTTGFIFLVEKLRKQSMLDAVHDITIGYPKNIPQNELDILKGNFPREIHFHIKRHPVVTLPISEEGLQNWCKQKWKEKEELLKNFYQRKAFHNATNVDVGISFRLQLMFVSSIMIYTTINAFFLYLLITTTIGLYFFIIACIFYTIAVYVFGGLDRLEILWYTKMRKIVSIFRYRSHEETKQARE
ncbi:lysocardiolipin acyltransferase 1-like [Ptychodera flava]|uniref:lysocardiolipin acyltransferase 1-like n=1 Tax=Ptychodera flava TaxID=63121 RepID=UPI00396A9C0E